MGKIYEFKYIYPNINDISNICIVNTNYVKYDGICGIKLDNIDKIQWYDICIDTSVQDSSIKNSLIGAVLAGTTGAIIGSNIKNNKSVKKICQCMEIFYYDNGIKVLVVIDYNAKSQVSGLLYELKTMIKEHNITIGYKIKFEESFLFKKKNNDEQNKNNSNNTDIPEQIKKLAELKDSGVLTKEEFVSKKQELLARL